MSAAAPLPTEADINRKFERHYVWQTRIFRIFDMFLGLFVRVRPRAVDAPRHILLANAGHLGDMVVTTALLPVLRAAFPNAQIDVLTGSYALAVLRGHPLIGQVHVLDHWYQIRDDTPRWRRVLRYWINYRRMLGVLREATYDVAIDARAWFPNHVALLWLAGIPVRAGYDRVGFGPTLTHRLRYRASRRHELDYQLDLLRVLGISSKILALARPAIVLPDNAARARARAIVAPATRYRILHPASSTPVRDWPITNWIELAHHLVKKGMLPVVTGRGPRDLAIAEAITAAVPGVCNACNRIDWDTLVALIEGAEYIYSVETSIGHLGAALGRPVVSIYGGMADPAHWAPIGARIVTHPLPCFPCFQKNGCATRACLTGITVAMVERTTKLETPSAS